METQAQVSARIAAEIQACGQENYDKACVLVQRMLAHLDHGTVIGTHWNNITMALAKVLQEDG